MLLKTLSMPFDNSLNCSFKVLDFKERSIKFTNKENKYYHPGKSCLVEYGNQLVASFGEVHPFIKKKFGIKKNILIFIIFN